MKERANGVKFHSVDEHSAEQVKRRLESVDEAWLVTARRAGVRNPGKTLATFRRTITEPELAD